MSTLATPEPPVAPAPGTRWAPARVGTWSRSQIVYIECPVWCTEDHADSPSALEDITHYGEPEGMTVPSFLGDNDAHYSWWARIECDPASDDERMRAAHLIVGDDSTFEARLTVNMAHELADGLVAFIAAVRGMAHVARVANEADAD
ncbi:DUF6907 domain-containing protein [Streptomyces huasconensis]|uniref:DUF6907 domain-containing protein n=1 Tax=Streptomyces huasconensis TaxID=1854574 RepID=UPI0036FBADCE